MDDSYYIDKWTIWGMVDDKKKISNISKFLTIINCFSFENNFILDLFNNN